MVAKKIKYPKVGRYIGSGYSKICYALGKDKVALLTDDKTIRLELGYIKKLKAAKVPVISMKLGKVFDETGELVPALIAPRYDFHTFEFSDRKPSAKHLRSLRKIRNALAKAKYDCCDLQFLAKRTGQVVICDPGYIYKKSANRNYSLSVLDDILN